MAHGAQRKKRLSSTDPTMANIDIESSRQGAVEGGVSTLKDLAKDAEEVPSSTFPSSTTEQQALQWCHQARNLWVNQATCQEDLKLVECLYRAALNAKKEFPASDRKRKRKLDTGNPAASTSNAALSPSAYRQAGERLSLLYLQSGRPQKAKSGLQYLGFTHRLAEKILNYPVNRTLSASTLQRKKKSKKSPPCCIMDEFLSNIQLKYLQSIFCDIKADYWTQHNYAVEPPSPYFSYVIPIPSHEKDQCNPFLQSLILQIFHCQKLRQQFPFLSQARYVELWAHNRPHSCGHQMHFDSDNEGRGGVRNPIISTILYLSENDDIGGPSLITNQTLQSTTLSPVRGWLAYGRPLRMVAFDGKVLHGVIPGKGVVSSSNDDNKSQLSLSQARRVTLMLAFWKDIQIRDTTKLGAARPFPKVDKDTPIWARKLNASLWNHAKDFSCISPEIVDPVSIDHVYEDLDGNPLPSNDAMPEYEQVFQGF
jgi:hypothetical protein